MLTSKYTLPVEMTAPYSMCITNSNRIVLRGRMNEQPYIVEKDIQTGNTSKTITPWCHHNHSCNILSHPKEPSCIIEACWWCDVVRSYNLNHHGNTIENFMGIKPENICSGPQSTVLVMDINGLLSQLSWSNGGKHFNVIHTLEDEFEICI